MGEEILKLTRGVPPIESFPVERLSESACAVLDQYGDQVLQYGTSRGFLPLRELVAKETGSRADQIIMGQGSLSLLDLCIRLLVKPGDLVYTEEPTYDRTLTLLRRGGARVEGIPLEDDGPDMGLLEQRLGGGDRPVLFYLIPDFQNPSGTVLSPEKRGRLVELARRFGFRIVEDVPYRRLRYRGQEAPTLLEIAPDRVIQMSSYSKLISPGLRVGYMVLPEDIAAPMAEMAEDTYINASHLNQAIIYDFVQRGWLEPQLDELRALYRPRLDATLAALDANMADLATWRRPDGGFFVGTNLNRPVKTEELLQRARDAGLLLTDGRGFYCRGGEDFVRLPFCALTEQEITGGVARLAKVVRSLS
ncbi:PLP-dependent aminotransferase family protein [Chloroflexota bacterium]